MGAHSRPIDENEPVTSRKRVVVLADPGQSNEAREAEGCEWPKLKNYQLPAKYVNDPNPARVCFWPDIKLRKVSQSGSELPVPEVYSVAELPRSDELFSNTALMIVNWDAANGDPLYRGDATLTYLRTRGRVPLKRFLDNGGVLLIESQTAQSRPVQESYDAIFSEREVTVGTIEEDELAAGAEAHILHSAKDHPIVSAFGDTERVFFDAAVGLDANIFVNVPSQLKTASSLRGSDGDVAQKLWFGWFTLWTSEWMPLLYVRLRTNDRYPVLLCKASGKGLIILSTMWLSVAQHPLASRVAEVAMSDDLLGEALKVQRRARARRRWMDHLVAGLVLLALLAATLGIVVIARTADRSWILAVLGVGVVGLTTLAWRMLTIIRARPLGVLPFKARGFDGRLIGKRN